MSEEENDNNDNDNTSEPNGPPGDNDIKDVPYELDFFDVKTRTKFQTAEWRIEMKEAKGRTRYFAVTKAPGGKHEAWRIVAKDFALRNM